MKYLKVFTNFAEIIEPLDDAEQGRLFRAMLRYAESGEQDELAGNERFVWAAARQIIDREREFCEKQTSNGSKGGRPKKPTETQANPQKPTETQKSHKEKEKEKENLLSNDKRDSKPTVEEVAEYCKERNNGIDPQHFVDYYQSQRWKKANGQPLTDWKAAVRYWESRERASSDRYGSGNYKQKVVRMSDLDNLIGGKT